MQEPSVGRVVHVLVDRAQNNGSDVAPAVLTRCWGNEASPEYHTVNLRLLLDAHPSDREWKTSARLFEDRQAAERYCRETAEQVHEGYAGGADAAYANYLNSGMFAFWPPRVP